MNTVTLDTLSISFPPEDLKLVKDLARKFGWKVERKKTPIEKAMEDVNKGRVYKIEDIDTYLSELLGVPNRITHFI